VDNKNCDSCGQPALTKTTCAGTKHPEHGFCFEDMKFCSSCLNKDGYCDWCIKKLYEMKQMEKAEKEIKRVSPGCAAHFSH